MKTDLQKEYKTEYTAGKLPVLLDVAPAQYLSITGTGDPDGPEYADKISCLYATAYTLKFMYQMIDLDFKVSKLEGLWSFDTAAYGSLTMDTAPLLVPRSEWQYRMMIRLPDYVTANQVGLAKQTVIYKKQLACAADLSLYPMQEGRVVQVLHTGPFSNEPETLALLQAYMMANGLKHNGPHHEIYLSDIRKAAPEKWRTILREPVA